MDQSNLRELQINQLMSSAFIQMSPEIPRDIFVATWKFIHDEVRHFRDVARTINRPPGVRAFEGRVLRWMRTYPPECRNGATCYNLNQFNSP